MTDTIKSIKCSKCGKIVTRIVGKTGTIDGVEASYIVIPTTSDGHIANEEMCDECNDKKQYDINLKNAVIRKEIRKILLKYENTKYRKIVECIKENMKYWPMHPYSINSDLWYDLRQQLRDYEGLGDVRLNNIIKQVIKFGYDTKYEFYANELHAFDREIPEDVIKQIEKELKNE